MNDRARKIRNEIFSYNQNMAEKRRMDLNDIRHGRCPLCQSSEGFKFKKLNVSETYSGSWGSPDIQFVSSEQQKSIPPPKTVRCITCNKRTDMNDAMGGIVDNEGAQP